MTGYIMMKTYSAKEEDLKKKWFLIDAEGKVLGRMATRIADVLRGKNKPIFTPHVDTGDFVVVINAKYISLTGNKDGKTYYNYSGYPGGLRVRTMQELKETKPEEIIKHAVKGMLPKNRLGSKLISRLFIYPGSEHDHSAQKPVKVKV